MKILFPTLALMLSLGGIQSADAQTQDTSQSEAMSLDMKDCATHAGLESSQGKQICLSQSAPGSLAIDSRALSRQRVDQLLMGKGDVAPSKGGAKGTQ